MQLIPVHSAIAPAKPPSEFTFGAVVSTSPRRKSPQLTRCCTNLKDVFTMDRESINQQMHHFLRDAHPPYGVRSLAPACSACQGLELYPSGHIVCIYFKTPGEYTATTTLPSRSSVFDTVRSIQLQLWLSTQPQCMQPIQEESPPQQRTYSIYVDTGTIKWLLVVFSERTHGTHARTWVVG